MSLRLLLNTHVRPKTATDPSLKALDCRTHSLVNHNPPQTIASLARDLKLTEEAIRQSLLRLENAGWVYRHLEPGRSRGRVYYPWIPLETEQHIASLLAQRRTTVHYFGEWLMRSWLDYLVPDVVYIDNAHPDWLITPRGIRLQLDRWYVRLNIAFEFQGRQHFQKGNQFVRTNDDLSRRLQYDGEKIRLCSLQNVKLIEVRGLDLEYEVFREKITGKLPLVPGRQTGPIFRQLLGMSRQYVNFLRQNGGG